MKEAAARSRASQPVVAVQLSPLCLCLCSSAAAAWAPQPLLRLEYDMSIEGPSVQLRSPYAKISTCQKLGQYQNSKRCQIYSTLFWREIQKATFWFETKNQ